MFLIFMSMENETTINKQNGVQIQVTNKRKLTNYGVKNNHIPNTSSKTIDIKEVMTLFQHKTRIKRRQQWSHL